jgi:hypothetical protein
MAEEKPKYDPKAKRKVRAEKYEEKVHFDGTLEQMIAIAVKPIKKSPDKGDGQ